MKKALTLLLLPLLPVSAAAQDTIRWTDGQTTDRARISEFTVFQIKYSARGSRDEKPSDTVVSLDVESVNDAYRRGSSANDPALLLSTARSRLSDGDKFVAQFGFYNAAKLFLVAGAQEDGFNTLDELKREIPDSGFLPDCYRMKIDYLLEGDRSGAAQAATLAREYRNAVTTGGLPQGFGLDAEFYEIITQYSAGSMNAAAMVSGLNNLLVRVSGPYPSLADKTRLWIATGNRAQGQAAEARKILEELTEKDGVDVNTRAGAYLGLGHLELSAGEAGNRDAFREALLSFLRVHEETKGARDAVVAESLYFAAEAAQKWGGDDYQFMNRRLKLMLASEYPDSPWAHR